MKYEFDSVADYYVGTIVKCLFIAMGIVMIFAWSMS